MKHGVISHTLLLVWIGSIAAAAVVDGKLSEGVSADVVQPGSGAFRKEVRAAKMGLKGGGAVAEGSGTLQEVEEMTRTVAVLMDIKQALVGSNEALLADWRGGTGHSYYYCNWTGVLCDARGRGHVVSLHLPNLNLQGTISPSMANLTTLRTLILSPNALTGAVPPSLGYLPHLHTLNLGYNSLHGTIPILLANCTLLHTLNLSHNHLTGHIPLEFDLLSKLTLLDLRQNQLSGTIPPTLSNCTLLQSLDLSQNNLTGNIPASFGSLPLLQSLSLASNDFSGQLPTSLANCSNLITFDASGNHYLRGYIPLEFGLLSKLTLLDLHQNQLSGTIPPTLSNCSALIALVLDNNQLTGSIPQQLGTLSALESLVLFKNNLSGRIPPLLANCTSLFYVVLHFNNLSGDIPKELGELPSLTSLYLSQNQLTGPIPDTFGNLSNLQVLYLSMNNALTGSIPDSLTNLVSLSDLDLGRNSLRGSIPASVGSLQSLQSLLLHVNQISGEIPFSLSNCTQLNELSLSDNDLRGVVPRFLGSLPQLSELDLSYNQFGGTLPELALADGLPSQLYSLKLEKNKIVGPIPAAFGKLTNLTLLYLNDNRLSGSIPPQLADCTRLYKLDLSNNTLQGPIPPTLGKLQQLEFLNLQWNRLQGPIPDTLGNCSKLRLLDLSHNNLHDSIPPSFVKLTSLDLYLNLSYNFLTGSMPLGIGAMTRVQDIDLSVNQFHGEIPNSIATCIALQVLNLSFNRLNGTIPARPFASLKDLQKLDLSVNYLSGEIPSEVADWPQLQFFNVSQNQLVGKIPDAFSHLPANDFADNTGLCGPPLSVRCVAPSRLTRFNIVEIVCSVFVVAMICCVMTWYNRSKIFRKRWQSKFLSQEPPKSTSLRVTAEELEVATKGYNESNLLGTGGSSKVYKGTLKNGKVVAIKRFNLENYNHEDAEQLFRKECETLGKIRHRNLVPILSTCCNLDMKAIVLEYMPNGSLEEHLFQGEDCMLDWEKTFNVAMDVVKALVYLHHESNVRVIHCDLKPSNILLDEDFVAHVADFGIAKLLSPNMTTFSASQLWGSIGYIAPECAELCHYSAKGDVYSYGVVLLCMLTRRQPTCDLFDHGIDISRWVGRFLPDRFLEALHPALCVDVKRIECEKAAFHVLRVALLCTRRSAADRPTSKQVLEMLLRIGGSSRSGSSSGYPDFEELLRGEDLMRYRQQLCANNVSL